jgi:hypothetical protein
MAGVSISDTVDRCSTARLQIGYLLGIGIRYFLIFTRTSLTRAAFFAASQPARPWSDGKRRADFLRCEMTQVARNYLDGERPARQLCGVKRPRVP